MPALSLAAQRAERAQRAGPPRYLTAKDPGGLGVIRLTTPPYRAVAWPAGRPIPARWAEPEGTRAALTTRGAARRLALELTADTTEFQRWAGGVPPSRPPRVPRVARTARTPRARRPPRFPRRPRRPRRPRPERAPVLRDPRKVPPPREPLAKFCMYAFDKRGRLADFNVQSGIQETSAKKWVAAKTQADAPPQIGLMGALTRRRGERYDAYYLKVRDDEPCPTISSNPCAVYAQLVAAGVQLVTRWTAPELPEAPKLAGPPREKKPRRKLTRKEFLERALGPATAKDCAALLFAQRFADARAGCSPAYRFTVQTDLAGARRPAAPVTLGDLDAAGAQRVIEAAASAVPLRVVVFVRAQ